MILLLLEEPRQSWLMKCERCLEATLGAVVNTEPSANE